jgi:hypothetical protein
MPEHSAPARQFPVMTDSPVRSRLWPVDGRDAVLRALAAAFGAPLTAAVVTTALARLLPVSKPSALAWGHHLLVPLWVLLACVLPLQRSGKRAWLLCTSLALAFAVPGVIAAWAAAP